MIMAASTQSTTSTQSAGGRLVATDGRELPLKSVHLAAQAGGGIARVVLTQRFENPFDQPLEVRYLLPLPSDGAVSGFSFTLGDQRITGEVTGKQQARERFQRAMSQGRTAALLEQDRTSLFTQRVGNVPPRTEIVAEVVVDQPLRWMEEGAWEWRFPTVVGPRYQGAPGRVPDAPKLQVPVASGALPVRATFALDLADGVVGAVESPSHAVETRGTSPVQVRLEGDGSARLDRDVVVRWPVALPDVSANVIAARPETAAHDGDTFALLTVAPPTGGYTAVPRDLTFLIDTSGSMGGRPLDQAKRVVMAMIETLGVRDRIEMIEFGSRPRRWKKQPRLATESNKDAARKWLAALGSSGCTEMHRAVLEALAPLRKGSQRQVVLVTDGYIGFEQEIVATLLSDLPAGARLHTVGVGSSVNRSLTEAAARAGRGTELIVGLDEDPDRLVGRLLARTTAPLVTDLVLEGEGVMGIAPRQLPDLYAESPALIAARLSGAGEVVLRGHAADGPFVQRFNVPALQPGQGPSGVAALFARETARDLETAISAGGNAAELNRSIEDTGIEFQIATRLTSWIAISKTVTVKPKTPRRTVEQPHELPHGVSVEGLGLRKGKTEDKTKDFGPTLLDDVKKKLVERGLRLSDSRVTTSSIISTDVDEEVVLAESSDELILEDSTSEKEIDISDLLDEESTRADESRSLDAFRLPVPDEAKAEAFFKRIAKVPQQPPVTSEPEPAPEVDKDVLRSRERAEPPTGSYPSIDAEDDAWAEPEPVIPTVEVPSISEDIGLVETDSDAALVEAGSDEPLETEAYELMDAPEEHRRIADRLTRDGAMLGGDEIDRKRTKRSLPPPKKEGLDLQPTTYRPREKTNLPLLFLALLALVALIAALVLTGVIPWPL